MMSRNRKLVAGAVAVLSLGIALVFVHQHSVAVLHSESYKAGYGLTHDRLVQYGRPTAKDFDQLRDSHNGGWTNGSFCALLSATQSVRPADAGDWVRGCVDAVHDWGMPGS